jgi:tetratricopeptide (TPR) repeat protein
MTPKFRIYLFILGAFLIGACDQQPQVAENSRDSEPAQTADTYGEHLGAVDFPVSCNDQAQVFMTRGVSLLHHMTYMAAEKFFNDAIRADPDCVLAYWGVAMTYVHPLWPDLTSKKQFARAAELIATAESIGAKTPREAAYLAAVKAYYDTAAKRSERERLVAFDAAWKKVYTDFPDDDEGAAFYALAHMATALSGQEGLAIRSNSGSIVEQILAQQPDHAAAHHYIIHAYDTPGFAGQALSVAQNYGKVAPEVPHALHMPTHIFTRLGLWEDSIEWNSRAARASHRETRDEAISTEYLHSADYLAYAYLQIGNEDEVREIMNEALSPQAPYWQQNLVAGAYALAAIPARYALERHQWQEAMLLQARFPESFPWQESHAPYEALTWFARGIGAARSGNVEAATDAIEKLRELRLHEERTNSNPYWAGQIKVQELAVSAWTAFARGDKEAALNLMAESAEIENGSDKHAVTPGELLPANELLGDLHLELGNPTAALGAYREALTRSPYRFNSLYGAAAAAEQLGDRSTAAEYFQTVVEMTSGSTANWPRLLDARDFVNQVETG